jgi:hypothetical protein
MLGILYYSPDALGDEAFNESFIAVDRVFYSDRQHPLVMEEYVGAVDLDLHRAIGATQIVAG